MSEFYQIAAEGTAFDTMDNSVLVINLKTAKYFHLTNVAARVWALIAEIKSLSEIKSILSSEYDVSTEKLSSEIQRFISELLSEALIIPVDGLSSGKFVPNEIRGTQQFESPILETFPVLERELFRRVYQLQSNKLNF